LKGGRALGERISSKPELEEGLLKDVLWNGWKEVFGKIDF